MTSCATIVSHGPDPVPCDSDPQGATVYLDGVPVGMTPCQVLVPKVWGTGDLEFRLDDGRSFLTGPNREMNGWIVGNIFLGGIIGLAVDCASGYCRRSRNEVVFVDFTGSGVFPAGVAEDAGDAAHDPPVAGKPKT